MPSRRSNSTGPKSPPNANWLIDYGLSAYDAAYLWLAAQLKAPLATFNRKLGEAAQAHLGALE